MSSSVLCGREATKEGHTFSLPLFLFRIKGGEERNLHFFWGWGSEKRKAFRLLRRQEPSVLMHTYTSTLLNLFDRYGSTKLYLSRPRPLTRITIEILLCKDNPRITLWQSSPLWPRGAFVFCVWHRSRKSIMPSPPLPSSPFRRACSQNALYFSYSLEIESSFKYWLIFRRRTPNFF